MLQELLQRRSHMFGDISQQLITIYNETGSYSSTRTVTLSLRRFSGTPNNMADKVIFTIAPSKDNVMMGYMALVIDSL